MKLAGHLELLLGAFGHGTATGSESPSGIHEITGTTFSGNHPSSSFFFAMNGDLVTGLLKPVRWWADTVELQARQRGLEALVLAHRRKGGYILGDLTKGGREATADEVGRLAGAGPEGRPRGLEWGCQRVMPIG